MGTSITDKAIEQFAQMMVEKMETLSSDWEKPWFSTTANGIPQNLSGRPYSRLNELFLFFLCEKHQYQTPVFLTFLQAKNEGIKINKGEKSFPVLFYNFIVKDIATGEKIPFDEYVKLSKDEREDYLVIPFLKQYNVFNLDQTSFAVQFPERFDELLNKLKIPQLNDESGMIACKELDLMLAGKSWLCPIYVEKGNEAYFSPDLDEIHVPLKAQFKSGESFYSALLHEMTHSTGTDNRLNRKFGATFGDDDYGREELVAELTAVLMCRELGISSAISDVNAAYLKGWIETIREEPKYLFSVLTDVGKAAAMIDNNIQTQNKELVLNIENPSVDNALSSVNKAYSIDNEKEMVNAPQTPLHKLASGVVESAVDMGLMEPNLFYKKKEEKLTNHKILEKIKQAYINGFPVVYNSYEFPPLFNNPEGFREFAEECGFSTRDVMDTFNQNIKEIEIFINKNLNSIITGNFPGNSATKQINPNVMQIDEQKINWQQLNEKYGITREALMNAGVLEEVLQARKSSKVVELTYESQDGPRQFKAKVRLQEKDGNVGLVYYPVRQAPDLDKPYFGYEFTETDKKSLLETGNLDHTAEIERNGENVSVFISVDSLTNDLVHADVARLKIPNEIKGVELSEQQKSFLLEGKPVHVKNMTSNAGNAFSSYVMVNAEKRSLEFVQLKPNIVENINELTSLNGVPISEENRKILSEGESVFVEGMTSKDGRTYSANIKYDPETKKIKYEFPANDNSKSQEFKMPNKIKGVVLTDEQKAKIEAGEKVFIKDMIAQSGKKFSNFVYIDRTEGKIKFDPFTPKEVKDVKESKGQASKPVIKKKNDQSDDSKKKGKGVKM